jgi:hypothetical protein
MHFTSSFTSALEQWRDFYLLAGTAAVTLMGLLFVALSIHLDVIVHPDGAHLNAMAKEAFLNLLFALMVSLMMLVPGSSQRPMGFFFMLLGAMRSVMLLRASRVAAYGGHKDLRRDYSMVRFLLPLGAYALLMVGGFMLFQRRIEEGPLLYFLPAIILMLIVATRGAWDLLVLVGRLKLERAALAASVPATPRS